MKIFALVVLSLLLLQVAHGQAAKRLQPDLEPANQVRNYHDNNSLSLQSTYAFRNGLSGRKLPSTDETSLVKLVASDGTNLDYFGSAVAMDEHILVIGAVGDNEGTLALYLLTCCALVLSAHCLQGLPMCSHPLTTGGRGKNAKNYPLLMGPRATSSGDRWPFIQI